mgnify:FL=1|jgi:2-oxoisovalerate dehydrogenase E1 component alpha subunit
MIPKHKGLYVPEPGCRPGGEPDFSHIEVPPAGIVPRPPIAVGAGEIRDHAFRLIRVLGDDGAACGEWNPALSPQVLHKGLRAMMLTRAYDARMVRVQR